MTTTQEVELLATLLRVLATDPPTDPDLATRVLQWRKQIATQLKRAAERLDLATP